MQKLVDQNDMKERCMQNLQSEFEKKTQYIQDLQSQSEAKMRSMADLQRDLVCLQSQYDSQSQRMQELEAQLAKKTESKSQDVESNSSQPIVLQEVCLQECVNFLEDSTKVEQLQAELTILQLEQTKWETHLQETRVQLKHSVPIQDIFNILNDDLCSDLEVYTDAHLLTADRICEALKNHLCYRRHTYAELFEKRFYSSFFFLCFVIFFDLSYKNEFFCLGMQHRKARQCALKWWIKNYPL